MRVIMETRLSMQSVIVMIFRNFIYDYSQSQLLPSNYRVLFAEHHMDYNSSIFLNSGNHKYIIFLHFSGTKEEITMQGTKITAYCLANFRRVL